MRTRPTRSIVRWLLLLALGLTIAACDQFNADPTGSGSDADGDGEGDPAAVDSDQDGLTDAQELELGTSPFLADSDGDGVPDAVELLDLGFDPTANPLRFNPRLADVPRIDVRIVSPPRVSLHHSLSESQTRSFDNTQSVTESQGFSTNTTNSESTRSEISHTVGGEVSGTYGMMSGVTVSANYSRNWSDSTETSFSWSDTESHDNSETLSESQGFSSGNDVVKSGGRVQVAVNLRNVGHQAFTVQTMALGLRKVDPTTGRYQEIGQLEPASDRTFQNITSLSPGESVDGLVFGAELSLEKAEFLLGDGTMSVRTLMYELTDQDGRPLDHQFTSINARTAEVTIDAGAGARTHYVATHTPDGEGLPLSTALSEVIGVNYEVGTTLWTHKDRVESTRTSLLSLNGVRTDSAAGGYWTVQIESDDGRGGAIHTIKPFDEDLDLDAIRLLPTTAVRLVYVVDADRDGLGERTETLLGTDPRAFDTDGDGVGDGDELLAGANPLVNRNALAVDVYSTGRTLTLAARPRHVVAGGGAAAIDWGDGSPAGQLSAGGDAGFVGEHEYAEFGEYTVTITPSPSGGVDARPQTYRIRVAETMTRQWRQRIEVDKESGFIITGIDLAPDGSVYVLGIAKDTVEHAAGEGPGLIARYNRAGERQWLVRYAKDERLSAISPSAMAVDPTGGVYTLNDRTLRKFDPSGALLWAKAVHSSDRARPRAMGLTSAGKVIVMGDAEVITKKVESLPNKIGPPLPKVVTVREKVQFLHRLDANGNIEHKAMLKYPTNVPRNMVIDRDDTILLVRNHKQDNRDTMLLTRFDQDGELIWHQQEQSPQTHGSSSLAVGDDGIIFVGGAVADGSGDGIVFDSIDSALRRYDRQGKALTANRIRRPFLDMIFSVAPNERGGVYALELVALGSARVKPQAGKPAEISEVVLVLATYDARGRRVGERRLPGLQHILITMLAQPTLTTDAAGNVYIAGIAMDDEAGVADLKDMAGYTFLTKLAPNPQPTAVLSGN